MSGTRRSRLRWVTVGEAVAIAAVLISGLGLWNSWQDRREQHQEKAIEAARAHSPRAFALRASPNEDGSTLTLTAVGGDQVVQGQTIRFPPAFKLPAATTTGDARIEAGWFADALKADRKRRALPDESRGDERLPVLIETDYLEDGQPRHARALYDLGYALEGRFLRGAAVRMRGLSLIGTPPAGSAAADRRLDTLWTARAGAPKP
ncbi:hypothetical protein [Sphingomonas morindae]|uniref:Transmembrane protein n=1 Tax=Sphingomonas morindae TaxID=1541170 RepID=A0ABY4X5M0_9SPHN|nr:hypothetical protein [Sphingomonas morindae]USI72152.1 hypothetical protein LHA26_12680 [Sphingomonas morindae]